MTRIYFQLGIVAFFLIAGGCATSPAQKTHEPVSAKNSCKVYPLQDGTVIHATKPKSIAEGEPKILSEEECKALNNEKLLKGKESDEEPNKNH